MAAKLTLEQFLVKAHAVHGDKYDYSLVEWTENTKSKTKLDIVCHSHGAFRQSSDNHINSKQGCPACSGKESLTQDSFVYRATQMHNNKYEYCKVVWTENTRSDTKVAILCPDHGMFTQRINGHLQGYGCAACSNNVALTFDRFVHKANEVHGGKYDYSSVDWSINTRAKSRVRITCPDHGPFTQIIANHLNNMGCLKCGGKEKYTLTSFVEKAQIAHGGKYDYSSVIWDESTSAKTKVTIMCTIHGIFKQTVDGHTRGQGCPVCKSSKGEVAIASWLAESNISYSPEHTFVDCRNPATGRKLPFDFYLPEYNTCIEFHGKQHYEPVKFSGTTTTDCAMANLKSSQIRDSIKEQYCKQNNIRLIIIPYTDITRIDLILPEQELGSLRR
jgi:hypothetical protein